MISLKSGTRAGVLMLWLSCLALAAIVIANARYVADLSAFLPERPTPTQQLLVDQLRDGPASRLVLIAIEGGTAAERAAASRALAAKLRRDVQFAGVFNGEPVTAQRDREMLFQHRYVLSDEISAARFSVAGLHAAIAETVDSLASPAGLLFKSLLPRDPTGELLHILDTLAGAPAPQSRDGVWVSPDGGRAIGAAQTAAGGADSDAQERAVDDIRTAFAAVARAPLQLKLSGPGVFAVAARAKIQSAALRLSLISSALVVALLLVVYRSPVALALGLLPVASGALLGIAAVALGFPAVHGITLGFGITLIGESVDYSIYYFIRTQSGWPERIWPTMRLGLLTSVCGFASLLPSGFPGLRQLGVYSISGLVAAAWVTRFVLPALLPAGFRVRDLTAFGGGLARLLRPVRRSRRPVLLTAALLAAAALVVLHQHRHTLWNRELAALSPISIKDQDFDAKLRADLGAADVGDLVVVSGATQEAVLRGAERAAAVLQRLVDAGVIGSFESPSLYLPSLATQEMRRDSLPSAGQLQDNLKAATQDLAVRSDRLQPFLEDVETTRHAALVTPRDLAGTSFSTGYGSLILHQRERWNALLPLHTALVGRPIDAPAVVSALAAAHLEQARVLDLKRESDALYADYLGEAIRLSLGGFAALSVLLLLSLRSALRAARVLAPLILAVLAVAAGLALCGVQLTILHLVGMLLIVAVGSNYALFFDREKHAPGPGDAGLTLASVVVANASTVIGFGLLSFSGVPVLVALGTTVAPGAFLALVFSALRAADA
jgi:predicted exporter